MEALGLSFGIALIAGKALVMGFLVYLPFWLLGRGCSALGRKLQEKADEVPR